MSIKLMSEVWQSPFYPLEKLILLTLADQANEDGFTRPDRAKLAALCSSHPDKIRDVLSVLENQGWLKVVGDGWMQVVIPEYPRP